MLVVDCNHSILGQKCRCGINQRTNMTKVLRDIKCNSRTGEDLYYDVTDR